MLYSLKEIAEKLGVSRKTVYRRIAEGRLDAIKLSQKYYKISEESYQKFISSCEKEVAPNDT